MPAKVTRRLLASLAAAPLLPQASAQQPQAEDDIEIQRQRLRRNVEQMAKVKLPMSTEPATVFKA